MTTEEKFWAKVDKNGPVPEHVPEIGNCWVWTGATQKGFPYGFFYAKPRLVKAHRYCWALHHGEIQRSTWVLHKCDRPACVRVDHLFLGNAKDNAEDRVAKNRGACGERQHKAKLTAEHVIALRGLHQAAREEVAHLGRHGRPDGYGSKRLALERFRKQYGNLVSKAEANGIMAGRHWRHLLSQSESTGEIAPSSSRGDH